MIRACIYTKETTYNNNRNYYICGIEELYYLFFYLEYNHYHENGHEEVIPARNLEYVQLICFIALNSLNTLEKKDGMICIPNYINNIYSDSHSMELLNYTRTSGDSYS